MSSNFVRYNKRGRKFARKYHRSKASSAFQRSAGAVDYVCRQQIVEAMSDTGADGSQYITLKVTYSPLTLLSSPFMSTDSRLKTKTCFASFKFYATNLNNFPLKLRVWWIKPKADFVFDNTLSTQIETLIDEAWVINGGTTGAWDGNIDFDWTMVPQVDSVLSAKYVGETNLEPQTEKQLFITNWRQAMTRTRAGMWSAANATNHLTRQDRFLFIQVVAPIVSGATASGRAQATMYVRGIWAEKWVVQNMPLATVGAFADDAGVSGASTVFHRDYVTTGSAVKGNTTLA